MATTFDTIFNIFFLKITSDPDFFSYLNVPELEVLEIMETKAFTYMVESIATILEHSTPDVDFNDYDAVTEEFGFEMTNSETEMLTNLMVEKFLSRDLVKLKIYDRYFTTNEINMFSPANERKTFVEMLSGREEKNIKAIKSYGSRDRLTNAYKTINGGVF